MPDPRIYKKLNRKLLDFMEAKGYTVSASFHLFTFIAPALVNFNLVNFKHCAAYSFVPSVIVMLHLYIKTPLI